ncbi:MAG: transposase [Chlamydiales bacterium]
MKDKRKKYGASEKAKIALEAIKGEQTLAQITSKYGIHATQINTWKKHALACLLGAFSEKSKQVATNFEAQFADLYEQIGRLKVENDYLKKKFEMFHS